MKALIFGKRNPAAKPPGPAAGAGATPLAAAAERVEPVVEIIDLPSPAAPDVAVRLAKLGEEVRHHVMDAYTDRHGLHSETVIGALAALNGEFALRATDTPLPDTDTFIPGGLADGLLFRDEMDNRWTIWTEVHGYALAAGVAAESLPDMHQIARASDAAIGSDNFPHLTVPRLHFPHEWSPDACVRLRDYVQSVAQRESLTPHETCHVLASALGLLVNEVICTLPDLKPEIVLRIAGEVMAGTARMAPLTKMMSPQLEAAS